MNPTAACPDDNPFRGSPVWSLGHRNVQGLAWDAAGRLWAIEFGQDRFDEVNLIRPGPQLRLAAGRGPGRHRRRALHQPARDLADVEASPSGAAIAGARSTSARCAASGCGACRSTATAAGAPQPCSPARYGRLRTVVRAPDGSLWVATSNRDGRGSPAADDDRIVRVTPVTR